MRRNVLSALFVLALVGTALWGFLGTGLRPQLGLDLVGGVSAVLEAPAGTDAEVVDRTVETIRERVDALGVAEPDITRQGDRTIQVQIPRVEEGAIGRSQERLLELIGRTGRLEYREVLEVIEPGTPAYEETEITDRPAPDEEVVLPEADAPAEQDPVLYRLGEVRMTGDALSRADAVFEDPAVAGPADAGWQILFQLTSEGRQQFADLTEELVGRQLAVVMEGRVESAPTITEPIPGGQGRITGGFSEAEARDLAVVLRSGALPVELERQQVVTVSPTLGRESLRQGLFAGIAGIAVVALYLLVYYRLLGILTWVGMAIWATLSLALISLLGQTVGYSLTLAGVAGLVVSVGIATDSNIVFYERLKDEVRAGKTLRAAVAPAFRRAWRTIIAADIVTITAALILYLLAVGGVRGFALTLGLATLLDMVVMYFFMIPLVFLLARSHRLAELPGLGLRSGVGARPAPIRGGNR